MIASKRLQYATNVNTGISSTISGSDTGVVNDGTLRSVSGLAFSNSTVRSFNVTVTVSIVRSSGGDLFETFTLEGNQKSSSWDLIVSSVGDDTSTSFSITSAGQVQHTTTVIANWTSTTIRFSGNQIVTSGTMTGLSTTTTGSFIVSSMQLADTTDAVNGTSNGGLHVLGGATIAKSLNTLNLNATGAVTAASLVMGSATASNMTVTGTLTGANLAMASITAGNLRVPGTLTVTNVTVNNLVQSSGSIIVSGPTNTIGSIITNSAGNVSIGGLLSTNGITGLSGANITNAVSSGSGLIGEVKFFAFTQILALLPNIWGNIGNITLTPGVYFLGGSVSFSESSGTTTQISIGYSTNTSSPNIAVHATAFMGNSTELQSTNAPVHIYAITSTTTIYVLCKRWGNGGNSGQTGNLFACRIA
jgi:hypothetical protein